MGRDFEEALVDEEGRMYRVAEPEILYLNVHRPRPESLTRNHVERLREAIHGCHPVRMRYVDRSGVKDTIRVQPYFLFHREGTFYLGGVQTHSGDLPLKAVRFKPFTITSMRCLGFDVLVEETFVPLPRYSAEKRLSRTGIRSLDGEAPIEAEFEVFGRFAYNACETDHGERSEHQWIRSGPHAQHLRMKATFGSLYDLVRYILSFGRYAVLDKPEDVRAILVDNIKGMAERYGLEVQETVESEKPSI
jgi:predicted DNA-binding transcriptional regulator YafY